MDPEYIEAHPDPDWKRTAVPRREHRYRVVVEGPAPEDLAERCAQAWLDIRLAAQHAAAARRVQERRLGDGDSAGAGRSDDDVDQHSQAQLSATSPSRHWPGLGRFSLLTEQQGAGDGSWLPGRQQGPPSGRTMVARRTPAEPGDRHRCALGRGRPGRGPAARRRRDWPSSNDSTANYLRPLSR